MLAQEGWQVGACTLNSFGECAAGLPCVHATSSKKAAVCRTKQRFQRAVDDAWQSSKQCITCPPRAHLCKHRVPSFPHPAPAGCRAVRDTLRRVNPGGATTPAFQTELHADTGSMQPPSQLLASPGAPTPSRREGDGLTLGLPSAASALSFTAPFKFKGGSAGAGGSTPSIAKGGAVEARPSRHPPTSSDGSSTPAHCSEGGDVGLEEDVFEHDGDGGTRALPQHGSSPLQGSLSLPTPGPSDDANLDSQAHSTDMEGRGSMAPPGGSHGSTGAPSPISQSALHFGTTPQVQQREGSASPSAQDSALTEYARSSLPVQAGSSETSESGGEHPPDYSANQAITAMIAASQASRDHPSTPPPSGPGHSLEGEAGSHGSPSTQVRGGPSAGADETMAATALLSLSPVRPSVSAASRGGTPKRRLSVSSPGGSAPSAPSVAADRHPPAQPTASKSAGWQAFAAWAAMGDLGASALGKSPPSQVWNALRPDSSTMLSGGVQAGGGASASWLTAALAKGRAGVAAVSGPPFVPPSLPADGQGARGAGKAPRPSAAHTSAHGTGGAPSTFTVASVNEDQGGHLTARLQRVGSRGSKGASAPAETSDTRSGGASAPEAKDGKAGGSAAKSAGASGVGRIVSRYLGVSWIKASQRWRADSVIDGKLKYLGCFHQEQQAARAVDQARVTAWDQKRKLRLNFPEEYPAIPEKSKACAVKKVAGTGSTPVDGSGGAEVRSRYVGVAWDAKTKMWKVRLTSEFASALFAPLPPEHADDGTHPAHLFTGGFGLAIPAASPPSSVEEVFATRSSVLVLFQNEDDAALGVDQSKYEQWRAAVDAAGARGARMAKPRFNFAERFMTTSRSRKRRRKED